MKYIKLVTVYIMSFAYTYVGIRHFIDPDFFLAIMPDYLPFHLELVYLSGLAEIILGLLLLNKKTNCSRCWDYSSFNTCFSSKYSFSSE